MTQGEAKKYRKLKLKTKKKNKNTPEMHILVCIYGAYSYKLRNLD